MTILCRLFYSPAPKVPGVTRLEPLGRETFGSEFKAELLGHKSCKSKADISLAGLRGAVLAFLRPLFWEKQNAQKPHGAVGWVPLTDNIKVYGVVAFSLMEEVRCPGN